MGNIILGWISSNLRNEIYQYLTIKTW